MKTSGVKYGMSLKPFIKRMENKITIKKNVFENFYINKFTVKVYFLK